MAHAHCSGRVARWASRPFQLLPVFAVLLTASGALFAAAPVATGDLYAGQKGKTLSVPVETGVLANDSDADLDPFTAILVDGSAADAKGQLTLNPNGSFEFVPDDNTTYFTSFTYKANDGADSNTVTVVIEINNNGKLPDLPIAVIEATTSTAIPVGGSVDFDGGDSSDPNTGHAITNFIWDFTGTGPTTDSGNDPTPSPSPTYGTAGLFIASLTVKDDIPLTSEKAFLPILVSNGTTGDGRMFAKKAQFAVSWSKHAAGEEADKFKISGVWNPSSFPANLTGLTVDLFVNGQDVSTGATLDEKGKFASPSGSSPSFKIAFNAAKGTYSIAGSLMDLRSHLGVADLNEEKTLPIALQVVLGGVLVDNDDCIAQVNSLYNSTKGKSAKASYSFGKNATPTGAFLLLKSSGIENLDTGGHKFSASGVIAGDLGTPIDPNGDITINIGGAAQIVVPASGGYITSGDTPAETVTTLVKGAVPELAKFSISNPKGKFQIATNELTGAGLDPAGSGGTADDLVVTIVVPTASGNRTFTTSVELKRSDINSTKWKR